MESFRHAGGIGRGAAGRPAPESTAETRMGARAPVYFTHSELRGMGYHQNAITRNVRSGRWTRPLSNFYLLGDPKEFSKWERHRGLFRAYSRKFGGARVASHWTAAELWGLPTSIFTQNTLAFTENRSRQGVLRPRYLTVFQRPLGPGDIASVDGIACTSLARTVLDCSLLGSFAQAVCSMESAMSFLSAHVDAACEQGGARRAAPQGRRAQAYRRRPGGIRLRGHEIAIGIRNQDATVLATPSHRAARTASDVSAGRRVNSVDRRHGMA